MILKTDAHVAATVLDVDQSPETELRPLGQFLKAEPLLLAQTADVQAEGVQAGVGGGLEDTLRHQQRMITQTIYSCTQSRSTSAGRGSRLRADACDRPRNHILCHPARPAARGPAQGNRLIRPAGRSAPCMQPPVAAIPAGCGAETKSSADEVGRIAAFAAGAVADGFRAGLRRIALDATCTPAPVVPLASARPGSQVRDALEPCDSVRAAELPGGVAGGC